MSRGPGEVQEFIKQVLRQRMREGQTEIYVRELAWLRAEAMTSIQPLDVALLTPNRLPNDDILPREVEQSVRRAVKTLVDDNVLDSTSRRLADFDEIERIFPFRASSTHVRFIRRRLLPGLIAHAKTLRPNFDRAANEHHALRELRDADPARYAALQAAWMPIDAELAQLAPASSAEHLSPLAIRVKGIELFGNATMTHKSDFAKLLSEWTDQGEEERRVREKVEVFYGTKFPLNAVKLAAMKSRFHPVLDMSQSARSVTLKDDAKNFLLRTEPALVSALPGHRPIVSGRRSFSEYLDSRGPKYEPMLNKLVDRGAFQNLVFVRLRANTDFAQSEVSHSQE